MRTDMGWMLRTSRFISGVRNPEDLKEKFLTAVAKVYEQEGLLTSSTLASFREMPVIVSISRALDRIVQAWKLAYASRSQEQREEPNWLALGNELDARIEPILAEIRLAAKLQHAGRYLTPYRLPADIKSALLSAWTNRRLSVIRQIATELESEYAEAYSGFDLRTVSTPEGRYMERISEMVDSTVEFSASGAINSALAEKKIDAAIQNIFKAATGAILNNPSPDKETQDLRLSKLQDIRTKLSDATSAAKAITAEGKWGFASTKSRLAPLVEAADLVKDEVSDYKVSRSNIYDIFLGNQDAVDALTAISPDTEDAAAYYVDKFGDMVDKLNAQSFFDPEAHEVMAVRELETDMVDLVADLTPAELPIPNIINWEKTVKYDDAVARAKAEQRKRQLAVADTVVAYEKRTDADGKTTSVPVRSPQAELLRNQYSLLSYMPALASAPGLLSILAKVVNLPILEEWSRLAKADPKTEPASERLSGDKKKAVLLWDSLQQYLGALSSPSTMKPEDLQDIYGKFASFLRSLFLLPMTADGIAEIMSQDTAQTAVTTAYMAQSSTAIREGQIPEGIDYQRQLAATDPREAYNFALRIDRKYHPDTYRAVQGNHDLLALYLRYVPGIPENLKGVFSEAPGSTPDEAYAEITEGGSPLKPADADAYSVVNITQRLRAKYAPLLKTLIADKMRSGLSRTDAEAAAEAEIEDRISEEAASLQEEVSAASAQPAMTVAELADVLWPTSAPGELPLRGDPDKIRVADVVRVLKEIDPKTSDEVARQQADGLVSGLRSDWVAAKSELLESLRDAEAVGPDGKPIQYTRDSDTVPGFIVTKMLEKFKKESSMKRDSKKIVKHEEFDRTGGIWEVDSEANVIRRKKMIANARSGHAAVPYAVGDIVAFATLDSFSLGKISEIKPETYILATEQGPVEVTHDNVFDNVDGQLF